MSASSSNYANYAIIDELELSFIEVVPHAISGSAIVISSSPQGKRFYVTENEWKAGNVAFANFAIERGIVTSESSTKDKVHLFASLFKGRASAYAHGYRKKDGGIGYAPKCEHEWKLGICPKKVSPKTSCANCSNRALLPLDDKALVAHFLGARSDFKDVIGLYTLDEDCNTHVLVADFDKHGWREEVTAYQRAGKTRGLDVALERSRSGNGGHAWIFFDEAIPASIARDLGCLLISAAMKESAALDFSAYDRLFPTQSTIPDGGFGNLIALPLQGQAHQYSNSVFIDKNFEAYPDQWKYLSGLTRTTLEEVQDILKSTEDGPLGSLAFSPSNQNTLHNKPVNQLNIASDTTPTSTDIRSTNTSTANAHSDHTPWIRDSTPLTRTDFPTTLSITKTNMLYIAKDGLTFAAQDKIRRLAAFGNPEFYRAQAMRQSVFGKPRVIDLGEDTKEFIAIPRGCEQKLLTLLKTYDIHWQIDDQRNTHQPLCATFAGTLRERQLVAANSLLKHDFGVLSAPTGFGKTVIGAYLIAECKMRTLIIVPKTALITQWQKSLEEFLTIDEEVPPLLTKTGRPSKKKRPLIGQIGGGKHTSSGIVDVATFQSLLEKGDIEGEKLAKDCIQNYDLIICDECHHGAAPQLELILRSARTRNVYGLSATPKRADGLESIIFMHCGPIRYRVSPKDQAAEQDFTRRLVPRFTRIRIPSLEPGSNYNQTVDLLSEHSARNQLIVDDTIEALKRGKTPLVITRRKEHAKLLAEKIREADNTVFLLIGEGTAREKSQRLQAVKDAPSNKSFAIVATGSYVGEGFDEPRLDLLVLAAPISCEGIVTQYSGRLHRERAGKNEVIVYDYVDTSIPMLDRMYKKRLKSYAKLGYEVAPLAQYNNAEAQIMDARSWQATFVRDIEAASISVRIEAPYGNLKLLDTLSPTLHAAVERGVSVFVIIKEPTSAQAAEKTNEALQVLSKIGCIATVDSEIRSGLVIIDEALVWYGSLPLLAFAQSDDCSLRFKSPEVAHDLNRV